jgi:CheY-like chemotaxis protein
MVIMADETIDLFDYMGSGETILIVDDVKEQRVLGSKMLKWLGYKVEAVSCGEDAVEYARHHSLDLIILDMIMVPGISGLETYERIIEFKPDQRAILASGYSKSDDVKKTLSLGAGTYLRKPYSIEQLARAVKLELTKNL